MTGPAVTLFPEGEEKEREGPTTLFPQAGDRMRQSLRLSADTPPDSAARKLRLQLKTGLPSEFLDRNLDQVEKEVQRSDFDPEQFRKTSPAVAQWLSEHPDHAALAKDDFANLGHIESTIQALKRGVRVGKAQSVQGRIGHQLLMNNDELDPASRDKLKALSAEIGKTPEGMSFRERILYNGALIYGQMSDALPSAFLAGEVGALAGGTAGALAGAPTGPGAVLTAGTGASAGFLVGAGARMADYTFEVESGQAYLALQQIRGKGGEGLDPTVMKAAAVGVGVLNAALEVVGEAAIAAPFRAAAKKFAAESARDMLVRPTMRSAFAEFGKHYATALAGETTTEVMQEMTNIVAEEVSKMASNGQFATVMSDPDQREQAISRLGAIAAQTAEGMLMVGLPGASVNLAASVTQARVAAQRENFYKALGEGVANSKTFQRLPEAMQQLVERATKNGPIENVYIDPEAFQSYFQSQNSDPREVARQIFGNTQEYDQAVQTGQAMEIPTSRYASVIAPTEANEFFARELRQTPDGLNAREADAFLAQSKEAVTAIEPEASAQVREELTKTIAQQITETGRFKGGDAETLAIQMAAFFTTQGERIGVLPTELYNRYALSIGAVESPEVFVAALPPTSESLAQPPLTVAGERRTLTAENIAARQRFDEAAQAIKDFPAYRRALFMEALRKPPDILELKQAPLEEYGGSHRPPAPRDDVSAPAYDITQGVYPDDVYGPNGARYYGHGEPRLDEESLRVLRSIRGKPDAKVTIYRAIPDDLTIADRIRRIERDKAYILKHGKVPQSVEDELGIAGTSGYYDKISAELDELRLKPAEDEDEIAIQSGDWVTLSRSYAKQHGESALRGNYKIISKKVKASELFTDGNSIHEFGYWKGGQATESDRVYDQTDFGQKNRGRIRITPERQVSIDLLENADFSTFLHESGHFYLEVLSDLAKANEESAADLATIRDWLGAKGTEALTREQHEQFARGMEAYMMEGIAPSIALRRAFFRFKAWLKALYSSLRSLDVQLTPEVRNVFDRMFASDAEIDAKENEASIVPIFTTAESAGMSETEFAAYRQTVEDAHIQATDKLRAKLVKDALREQLEWWKEARSEIRTEVEDRINQEPVHRALSVLQRGENPDGTAFENPFKLSKAGITELRGEEFTKRLPRPYVYSREGGVHPDQAAELLGFSSGDELLQALADAPKKSQVIDSQTDALMKERYGDMLIDGSLEQAAEEAVLGENRERVIRAELRALRKKAQEVKPFVEAERTQQREARAVGRQVLAGVPSEEFLRTVAQARISQLRVRDIKPFTYWVAARKANKAVIAALAKGDYVEAANAQQTHLLNVAIYREAVRSRDEIDKTVDYARKLQGTGAQKRLGKAGQEYLDQINRLLERFDFSPRTLREADRRASLAQFIQSQEAKGLPVDIPEDIQNEAFRQPWQEMRYGDLLGVRDVLKHIDHLSVLKNKLLKSVAKRTLEDAVAEARASIEQHAKVTLPPEPETRLPQDQARHVRDGYFASHRKLSSMIREMDGFEEGGAVWDLVIRPLNDASDQKQSLLGQMGQKADKIFDEAYSKADMLDMYVRRFSPELQAPISKMGKLMMALNWGNEDNRAKLLAGLSIAYRRTLGQSEVEALFDTLDERDWNFVQKTWDHLDSYWPQMKQLAERLDGIAPEKVQATPVKTKFGEFKGGYFPIAYDDRQSRAAYRDVVAKASDRTKNAAGARASTKAGSRNERISNVRRPLRLDFGVIFEHLEEIALDLTHTETLLDVNRIVGHEDFESSVRAHYGDIKYKLILDTIRDIAAGDVPAQNFFDKSLNYIRIGTTIAGLGLNLTTSLLQPLGLTQSMVRIGPKWVAKGITRWLRDAVHMENTAKWIQTKSEFMRGRTDSQTREVSEIRNRIGLARGRIGAYLDMGFSKATLDKIDLQDVEDSYFWLITRMQLVADIPTWLGAYEKALESFPEDESKAIALADQAVLDAQGGGNVKDLAQIQRGNPALKLWTNFYSFFSTTWNLTVESVKTTDFKKPASVGRLGVDLLLLSVVPTVLGKMLRDSVRGKFDDDWKSYLRETLSYLVNMFVGLREIGGVIQGFHGYEGPAGTRLFGEIGKLIQQVQQGDSDKALWRALNSTAGILLHYPAGQVQRTVEGFMALQEGKTRNPGALLFGPPKP